MLILIAKQLKKSETFKILKWYNEFYRLLKIGQVESFYEDEVNKSMNASWQSNSKLNALIILLESGLSASKIYRNNRNIAHDLMSSISERSSACLVK